MFNCSFKLRLSPPSWKSQPQQQENRQKFKQQQNQILRNSVNFSVILTVQALWMLILILSIVLQFHINLCCYIKIQNVPPHTVQIHWSYIIWYKQHHWKTFLCGGTALLTRKKNINVVSSRNIKCNFLPVFAFHFGALNNSEFSRTCYPLRSTDK